MFSQPGRMIVDLNNIVDESLGLNGEYDVRFSATFFAPTLVTPSKLCRGLSLPRSMLVSDLIIPLSNLSPDQANYAAVPPTLNTTVKLPRNAAKAFAEVFASGNSAEEFWYFNLADSWLSKLPSGTTYGKGAHREVRLLVDGKLAGVVNPYPVIFTGGQFQLTVLSINLRTRSTSRHSSHYSQTVLITPSQWKSSSIHNGIPVITDDYSYPLDIDFWLVTENNASGWNTILDHGFDRKYLPNTLTPYNEIHTKRLSTGSFLTAPNGTRVVANGTAVQDFTYWDAKLNTYQRHVEARNSNVTSDKQSGTLTWTWPWTWGKLPKGASGAHSDYVARLPVARDADIIF
ncbi:hypothetical protein RSAG8_00645, partial [Rhizoctonia solani AG-8 WAC10335]